jgi:hypothetical protein
MTTATNAIWIAQLMKLVDIKQVIVAVLTLPTVANKDYGMNLVISFSEFGGLMKIRVELWPL